MQVKVLLRANVLGTTYDKVAIISTEGLGPSIFSSISRNYITRINIKIYGIDY